MKVLHRPSESSHDNVGFCCERFHKTRLWGRGSPSHKVMPWPHNRYHSCARRQQASLCGASLR